MWLALVFDHIVPILVMRLEWSVNSISIDWNRYYLYVLAGVLYLAATITNSFYNEYTYASMNWPVTPLESSFCLAAILAGQPVCYWLCVYFTNIKLSK